MCATLLSCLKESHYATITQSVECQQDISFNSLCSSSKSFVPKRSITLNEQRKDHQTNGLLHCAILVLCLFLCVFFIHFVLPKPTPYTLSLQAQVTWLPCCSIIGPHECKHTPFWAVTEISDAVVLLGRTVSPKSWRVHNYYSIITFKWNLKFHVQLFCSAPSI